MVNALTIAISFDSPALLPLRVPVTPEQVWQLAMGEPLAYWMITTYAETVKEALILNSIYNTGDAIMANVLNAYNQNFTDTAENQLVAIANAVGEMIGSLKISNVGGSNATITIRIKDAAGTTTKFECTELVPLGGNLVAIDGLEKVNILDTDQITVQSSASVSVYYYLSTFDGVDVT